MDVQKQEKNYLYVLYNGTSLKDIFENILSFLTLKEKRQLVSLDTKMNTRMSYYLLSFPITTLIECVAFQHLNTHYYYDKHSQNATLALEAAYAVRSLMVHPKLLCSIPIAPPTQNAECYVTLDMVVMKKDSTQYCLNTERYNQLLSQMFSLDDGLSLYIVVRRKYLRAQGETINIYDNHNVSVAMLILFNLLYKKNDVGEKRNSVYALLHTGALERLIRREIFDCIMEKIEDSDAINNESSIYYQNAVSQKQNYFSSSDNQYSAEYLPLFMNDQVPVVYLTNDDCQIEKTADMSSVSYRNFYTFIQKISEGQKNIERRANILMVGGIASVFALIVILKNTISK